MTIEFFPNCNQIADKYVKTVKILQGNNNTAQFIRKAMNCLADEGKLHYAMYLTQCI